MHGSRCEKSSPEVKFAKINKFGVVPLGLDCEVTVGKALYTSPLSNPYSGAHYNFQCVEYI